jgi:hypothetical protein
MNINGMHYAGGNTTAPTKSQVYQVSIMALHGTVGTVKK